MDNNRQSIHRLAGDQYVKFDHITRAVADGGIVQRGISPRPALELIVEIHQDLHEGDFVGQEHPCRIR